MSNIPRHIGFIADGNRRWAKAHNLPTLEGHRRGASLLEPIIEFYQARGVEFISFFLFSTENWDRSPAEVAYLMKLIAQKIQAIAQFAKKHNLRILILGRPEPVDAKLWQNLQDVEQETASNTGTTVCICFNYGGLWEIADAATKAIRAGESSLTPKTFRKYLYHPEVPALDLVVRTSGEQRLSGFQLWRSAYAELLFLQKKFPELEKSDFQAILDEYNARQRRFGK